VLLAGDDPLAAALVSAIHAGDLTTLGRLVAERPELASARIAGRRGGSRSLLHVAADWPGYFPEAPAVVRLLVGAGADPNGGVLGVEETPLHWAASSDDADVAVALLDGGADLEAQNGSIGTPLENAVGYGCWSVARLLLARGAKVDKLWAAAGLGLLPWIEQRLAEDPAPAQDEIDHAFWQACHGGHRRVAEYLLARGAAIDAHPDHSDATPLDIAGSLGTQRDLLVEWLRKSGARSAQG
jgi:ankyrin repeat protein